MLASANPLLHRWLAQHPILARVAKWLLLPTLTTLLMLSDDFLQQLYTPNNQAELEFKYVLVLWLINLCLWLSGRRWFINLVLLLFATMELFQLSYISFVGSPITPFDLSKLVSEWGEINHTLSYAFADHWPALVAWGLPWGALFVVFNWGVPRWNLPRSWIALLIVILVLGSKPERATRRDMIAFMPGPTRSSLHNSINVFSYYFTRMAGREMAVDRPDYQPYQIVSDPMADAPENIVLVIPDSTRYDHMSVYGYGRDTTPYLETVSQHPRASVVRGIASSVATGASLPLLFNVINEPGNVPELERGIGNLFRQAKANGYKTFWLSTHESKMLNGVGSRFLDVSLTKEDDLVNVTENGDRALLDWIDQQQWGEKNFIAIVLRSVHSPYRANYDQSENPRYRAWPTEGSGLTPTEKRANAYDNALLYLDDLYRDARAKLEKQLKGDTVWVLTSDHGQMLGENGLWGHNRLTKAVSHVPMVIDETRDNPQDTAYALPDYDHLSHYELGHWLLSLMGENLVNPNAQANVHYFHSEKLYEDNFYEVVVEKNNQLIFCGRQLLSQTDKPMPCQSPEQTLAHAPDAGTAPTLSAPRKPTL